MKYLNNKTIILIIGLLFAFSSTLHAFSCDEINTETVHFECNHCGNDISDSFNVNNFIANFSFKGSLAIEKIEIYISEYFSNFHSRAPPISKV